LYAVTVGKATFFFWVSKDTAAKAAGGRSCAFYPSWIATIDMSAVVFDRCLCRTEKKAYFLSFFLYNSFSFWTTAAQSTSAAGGVKQRTETQKKER
jgi:hypothetical protein